MYPFHEFHFLLMAYLIGGVLTCKIPVSEQFCVGGVLIYTVPPPRSAVQTTDLMWESW